MKLVVTENFDESSRLVADMYKEVIRDKEDALIGCATGGTPVGIYRCLVEDYQKGEVDFAKVKTVNLDEYVGLGKEHDQSFAYFMDQHFFSKTNIKEENIFLLDGDKPAESELERFNEFLQNNTVDILMLGIGNNGHIGFNEPDTCFTASAHKVELAEDTIKANSRFFKGADEVPGSAMTMGMYGITKAKKVVLIATGGAKAEAIKKLLADDKVDPMLPVSIMKLCKDATVVIDRELYELTK